MEKEPNKKQSKAAYRDELVKKAYEKVGKKLDGTDGDASKAIDDLVKLLKADKDLGVDETNTKDIELQWVPSENEEKDE